MSRSIEGWSGSYNPWVSGDPQLVRILPPPPTWGGTKPGHSKTLVFCRLARLEKRLDFRCATRNTTPQAPCTELHGRYRTPKELARNAKNPGKTFGFAAERTGTELFDVFPMFLDVSKGRCRGIAMSGAGSRWRMTEVP